MALPTLSKTWTIRSNLPITISGGPADANRKWVYAWKENMKLFGATVSGSSDGSTSGMDGTDRITDYTKWVQAGSYSWIVLRFATLATKFEVLVAGDYNDSGYCRAQSLVVSPSAGFGTVNGGTNGSTSSRPTATDGWVMHNQNGWLCANNTTYGDAHRADFWNSSDGLFTYWARLMRSQVWCFGFLGKPSGFCSEWTSGQWVLGDFGATGSCATRTNFHTNAYTACKPNNATQAWVYFTAEAVFNQLISQYQNFASDMTAGYPMCPIGLYSTTTGVRGRLANVPDLWFGAESNVALGDCYPGDGSRQFVQLDHLILPWDGSVPVIAN